MIGEPVSGPGLVQARDFDLLLTRFVACWQIQVFANEAYDQILQIRMIAKM